MSGGKEVPTLIPFGPFEADLPSQELRKQGVHLRLPRQSFQILKMLLERPGDLVTREELRQELWPSDTFVDFEHGLNAAINRLRDALGDSADNPKFIETLPRRGYRFIGPVNGAPKNEVEVRIVTVRLSPRLKLLAVVAAIVLVLLGVARALWHKPLQEGTALVSTASIAVLPFLDLSPSHDQEYLGDGMAEEILNNLAKTRRLRVVGRTSAFQFKGKNEDLRVIGQRLNVSNVLEGSVRKDGTRVRIAVQLIKTADGYDLWSNSYDRNLSDLFALQDDIANAVTTALRVQLPSAEVTIVREPSWTANPDAYQAFMQARYFGHMDDPGSYKTARQYATRSIQLDPAYAPAYALRAHISIFQGMNAWADYKQSVQESRRDAEKAIALAPKLADGYRVISVIQGGPDSNCPAAEKTLKKARELAPADPDILGQGAMLAMCQGRLEEAVTLTQQELMLDPLRPMEFLFLGQDLRDLGRFEEAHAALQKALDLNPSDNWMIHEVRGEVYLWQGRPQDALEEMEKEPPGYLREMGLALAYYALGRQSESNLALGRLTSQYPNDAAYQIAQVYAYRGEVDQAFQWLDRAYKLHDSGLMWFKTDLKLKSLRSDPRYNELLRRMHLAQ
jgi:TolB-like protein/DNA-binding winged helix-turn-helix (wHTH) protein